MTLNIFIDVVTFKINKFVSKLTNFRLLTVFSLQLKNKYLTLARETKTKKNQILT
jgi:hypothetical protein